jgi:hypothetical protein
MKREKVDAVLTSFSTRRKSSITLWIFEELSSLLLSANAIINLRGKNKTKERKDRKKNQTFQGHLFFLFHFLECFVILLQFLPADDWNQMKDPFSLSSVDLVPLPDLLSHLKPKTPNTLNNDQKNLNSNTATLAAKVLN